MKGPALWLKHYLRCREVLSHGEWLTLMALGARHGLWTPGIDIAAMPATHGTRNVPYVNRQLRRLEDFGLVTTRYGKTKGWSQWVFQGRITDKGLTMLGWPELTAVDEEEKQQS